MQEPNLTINQKINFRSWFRPVTTDFWFMRINRPYFHSDRIIKDWDFKEHGNRIDIPFTPEITHKFSGLSKSSIRNAKK